MNEHQLQKHLTGRWVDDGSVIAGERLFLAAWEVMGDYQINSAQHGFGRPDIDFVLLDAQGRMVALELKVAVRSPRECWSVLCQVTHRAQRLAEEYDPQRLEAAYRECRSGRYGRIEAQRDRELLEAHADSFGIPALDSLPGLPVRRVVAATEFGSVWAGIQDAFEAGPRESIVERLSWYSPQGAAGREFRRWRDLAADDGTLMTPGVITRTLALDRPTWSPATGGADGVL